MREFRRLEVWKVSHEMALASYKSTANFPVREMYGLTSQIRRAASSIPANIAEGCGRGGDRELVRFLRIARGSAVELEYHLLLSRDLGLLEAAEFEKLAEKSRRVQRMIGSMIHKITKRSNDQT